MTYRELTIHQKINTKAHAVGLYFTKPLIARVSIRDPWCYGDPSRLPMKGNCRFDLRWNQTFC